MRSLSAGDLEQANLGAWVHAPWDIADMAADILIDINSEYVKTSGVHDAQADARAGVARGPLRDV